VFTPIGVFTYIFWGSSDVVATFFVVMVQYFGTRNLLASLIRNIRKKTKVALQSHSHLNPAGEN